ncbi:ATP-binding protein [Saccharopolyspora sp. CA-218241]|uniref:ATP-binding protein n=1 Tax=Saccharopolyspora sp. CA-218241 TaxID=3240027 RepID=UPI003D99CBA3
MATREDEETAPSRADDFHRPAGPAEPTRIRTLRRELAAWATGAGMSEERVEALALAANEALANSAEHAHPAGVTGSVAVWAVSRAGTVDVTISDDGRWRPPGHNDDQFRGRGLLLIRSLADEAEVRHGERGTTVRMAFRLTS